MHAWARRLLGLAFGALAAGCVGEEPIVPTGPECAAPLVLCGESCVDTASDGLNCGACGKACDVARGEGCEAGSCASAVTAGCTPGTTSCGENCVDTKSDAAHCGDCDTACDVANGEVCSNGKCALACASGTTECGGDCVDTTNDPAHCGACATACDDGQVCSAGECALTCEGGAELCGKSCVDFASDPLHCGDCATACDTNAGETCDKGACKLVCSRGTTQCGDACVDTTVDPNHCGGCDVSCDANATCDGGSCACADGFAGDGKTCTDVDECAGDNDCSPSGVCLNTPGGYACTCRDAQTGDGQTCTGTELVTVARSGAASTGTPAGVALSRDGRYVAFISAAEDLVDGAPTYALAYERDMWTGTTTLASVTEDGDAADAPVEALLLGSNNPRTAEIAVSGDGNFVSFMTTADNFDYEPQGAFEVFVRDIAGNTTLVRSDGESGAPVLSEGPAISDDGSSIAFTSADQLAATSLGGREGIYERSVGGSDSPVLVSLDAAGNVPLHAPGCDADTTIDAERASVSGDGKRVVFDSGGIFTDDPDTNCTSDVFLRDLSKPSAPATLLVSVTPDGKACTGDVSDGSDYAVISANGKFVAFASNCVDLMSTPDQLTFRDVFVRDLVKQTTTRASVTSKGLEADGDSDRPQISADGRYVAFTSFATNLVADDTNAKRDLFVRDMVTNTTVRVDLDVNGHQLDGGDELPHVSGSIPTLFALSSNGAAIAFVANETGGTGLAGLQVYLRYLR